MTKPIFVPYEGPSLSDVLEHLGMTHEPGNMPGCRMVRRANGDIYVRNGNYDTVAAALEADGLIDREKRPGDAVRLRGFHFVYEVTRVEGRTVFFNQAGIERSQESSDLVVVRRGLSVTAGHLARTLSSFGGGE